MSDDQNLDEFNRGDYNQVVCIIDAMKINQVAEDDSEDLQEEGMNAITLYNRKSAKNEVHKQDYGRITKVMKRTPGFKIVLTPNLLYHIIQIPNIRDSHG
jgi:hypothetical protein